MGDSLPEGRFPFSVIRSGDQAAFVMDTGGGACRPRHMPCDLLRRVGEACQTLLGAAKERIPEHSQVPLYPGYIRVVTGYLPGVCRITLGCHRLPGGEIERVVALYDEGDDSAPVLVLIEEQIDEFIRQT